MRPCPICGGSGVPRLTSTDRNRAIDDATFEYRACRDCATLYLADVPTDLGRYYPAEYYVPQPAGASDESEQAKLALLRRYATGGALIEVGPGAGGFAREAREDFDVRAIEMDERACARLRSLGVETVQSAAPHKALATMAPSRAIVLWHAFEHLLEPVALLRAAASNVSPGGVLLVAVPNPAAFGLRVLGARWAHVDAPRHLQLVPAATLLRLAREVGFVPVALTGSDRAARDWNVFAWQRLLAGPASSPGRLRAAFYAGAVLAELLAPIERHGLRGSTYTAVFRNDAAT